MIVKSFLAASLTLAFASATAFAQDAAPAAPAAEPAAAAPAMAADAKPAKKAMHHHKKKAMHHGHGHVPGDPAVIDHSADHLIVTPTESKVNAPAGGH
jgi:hypothetical protein